ncbi:hypothetical protein OAQ47_01795 [Paracoccaceae bacterium]|nr:hypothetical protein [Paracoccaceae bacterium]
MTELFEWLLFGLMIWGLGWCYNKFPLAKIVITTLLVFWLTLAVPLFCLGFGVYYLLQEELLFALIVISSGGFLSLMFFAVKEPYSKIIKEAWSEFKRARAD